MLYVYVEIRYRKQLEKIHSGFMDSLWADIQTDCTDNGGRIFRGASVIFAGFDESVIGSLFGAVRALLLIRDRLETHIKHIGEYTILADISRTAEETEYQLLRAEASRILTETGIFCLPAAAEKLKQYLSFADDRYPRVTGRLKAEVSAAVQCPAPDNRYPFVPREGGDLLVLLRNSIDRSSAETVYGFLNDDERSQAKALEHAAEALEKRRYISFLPEYVRSAFLEWCRLWFTALRRSREDIPDAFCVWVSPEWDDAGELTDSLREFCASVSIAPSVRVAQPAPEFIPSSVPPDLLELAWILFSASDYLFRDEFTALFESMGRKKGFLSGVAELLCEYGIAELPGGVLALRASCRELIREFLGERCVELDTYIGEYLWNEYLAGRLEPGESLYNVLSSLSLPLPPSFLASCVYAWLEREPWKNGAVPFKLQSGSDPAAVSPDAEKIQALLRCRQLFGDASSEASREIEGYAVRAGTSLLDTCVILECGEWRYGAGALNGAVLAAKTALERFQREKNKEGECRCFTLLAQVQLARGSSADAAAYFEYAADGAEKLCDRSYLMKARFSLACNHFIEGNFSCCLRSLDHLFTAARELYAREWEVSAYFLRGRCFFELGGYADAEQAFSSGAKLAGESSLEDAAALCFVWLGRVYGCTGRVSRAKELFSAYREKTPDAYLFTVENAVIQNGAAAEEFLTRETIARYRSLPPWTQDHLRWQSGFKFLEDRLFICNPERSVGVRLLHAFLTFYDNTRNPDHIGAAGDNLASYTRSDMYIEADPYNYLYSFLLYLAEQRAGTQSQLDRTTLLSKSFKLLQKRANHIDEFTTRSEFLRRPYWVCLLYEEARKNMLI